MRSVSEQAPPTVEAVETHPLNYATPENTKSSDNFLRAIRRVLFAVGLGLLLAGVGTAWSPSTEAAGLMGFGGGLIGLTVPFPRQRRWR